MVGDAVGAAEVSAAVGEVQHPKNCPSTVGQHEPDRPAHAEWAEHSADELGWLVGLVGLGGLVGGLVGVLVGGAVGVGEAQTTCVS